MKTITWNNKRPSRWNIDQERGHENIESARDETQRVLHAAEQAQQMAERNIAVMRAVVIFVI
jgi:hypothetical protein